MILLDTHVWVWWVSGDRQLSPVHRRLILEHEAIGIGVSLISCWEIAKKVELGNLELEMPVDKWLDKALKYPGIQLIPLSLPIVLESTRLPQPFHRDPADQMIVATARIFDLPLLTEDRKILTYPHVNKF